MKVSEIKHSTWPRKRLRFALRKRRSEEEIKKLASTQKVAFLPMEAISDKGDLNLSIIRQKADVENGYTLFFDNDVVVAKITPCFENGKGALVHSLYNGIGYGTTELFVLSPSLELDSKFLFYVTISEEFRLNGEAAMKGAAGQKRVPPDFIQDFEISLPPLLVQHEIANYLDRETAEIDVLVAEKERMLALLEEKRQALISHIVTRGLDPNTPLKPSGLPWLGDIPQHWTTCQLKRTWKSSDYGISENIKGEGDVKVLRMTCIEDGVVDLSKGGEVESVDPYLLLEENDLLFNRTNSLDQIAKIGIVKSKPQQPTTFASYLVRIRTNDMALPDFLAIYLNAEVFLKFARKNAIPAIGQANLSPSRYGEIKIALPPKSEQEEIVSVVSSEHERTRELRENLIDSIALLKERRSALITAAVTGQIPLEDMAA